MSPSKSSTNAAGSRLLGRSSYSRSISTRPPLTYRAILFASVRDETGDEPEGLGRPGPLALERLVQIVEAAEQQLLLVGEVHVEGRATDVGALAYLLHADRIPAALEHERSESITELLARATHPTIERGDGDGSTGRS